MSCATLSPRPSPLGGKGKMAVAVHPIAQPLATIQGGEKGFGDRREDVAEVIFYGFGGDTKNAIACCFKESLSLRVLFLLRLMDAAIHFDNQTMAGSAE